MVEIRKLPANRWREYRRLRLEALKQSPLAFGSAFEEEASSGEKTWKKYMKTVSFAIHDDEPVGMIVCVASTGSKFRHISEIYSFYVKPAYRGRGIGKELLDHALAKARRNARTLKVRLYVNSRQRAAIGLYEKAGFIVVGRLKREMKVGLKFYTMLVMEKPLR